MTRVLHTARIGKVDNIMFVHRTKKMVLCLEEDVNGLRAIYRKSFPRSDRRILNEETSDETTGL